MPSGPARLLFQFHYMKWNFFFSFFSLEAKHLLVGKHFLECCHHCMAKGHLTNDCRVNKGRLCGVGGCSKPHHPLVHPYEDLSETRLTAQFILNGLIAKLVLDVEAKRKKFPNQNVEDGEKQKLIEKCVLGCEEKHGLEDCPKFHACRWVNTHCDTVTSFQTRN